MSAADARRCSLLLGSTLLWEAEAGPGNRHHLRVDVDIEKVFWNASVSGPP
jgi:hypothetical protein